MIKEFRELYEELYYAWKNIKGSNNKRKITENDKVEYTRFTAMQGHKYNKEKDVRFLLIGRAVNGWGEYFGKDDSKESFVESSVANLINAEESFSKNSNNTKDRFEWIVTETGKPPHNTFRDGIDKEDERNERGNYKLTNSPFWNYTKEIYDKLNCTENGSWNDRWFEKIAWTNLYKIAPTGKIETDKGNLTWGENPNTTECEKQVAVCRKLLKAEIEYFNPTHILMITGEDWFVDFEELFTNINGIGKNINRGENKNDIYLEKTAEYVKKDGSICKVAIACRPEQRSKEKYVKQISDYFINK